MGTKNDPGEFDCYAKAEPDEPVFVLLGRDRHASFLVRLWAVQRRAEGEDPAKVLEAMECADAMEAHCRGLGKEPFDTPGWAQDAAGEKYAGHTLREAVEVAMRDGSIEGWEWLQAWWHAELEEGDTGPGRSPS